MTTLPQRRPPTHPGEMLLEEFLKPLNMTQAELAERMRVSYPRVNEIIHFDPDVLDVFFDLHREIEATQREYIDAAVEFAGG